VVIPRLVRVQTTVIDGPPATAPDRQKARAVTFTFTLRYFFTPDPKTWAWCPIPGQFGCAVNSAYKDISTTVEIGFRNNVLISQSPTGLKRPERLYGGLYFYQPMTLVNY
jgi:hypothetical protein